MGHNASMLGLVRRLLVLVSAAFQVRIGQLSHVLWAENSAAFSGAVFDLISPFSRGIYLTLAGDKVVEGFLWKRYAAWWTAWLLHRRIVTRWLLPIVISWGLGFGLCHALIHGHPGCVSWYQILFLVGAVIAAFQLLYLLVIIGLLLLLLNLLDDCWFGISSCYRAKHS